MGKILKSLLLTSTSPLQRALFLVAQTLGVVVIVLSLLLYFDVRELTSSSSHSSGVMVVTKPISVVGALLTGSHGFSERDIARVERVDGVQSVGAFHSGEFRASAALNLFEQRSLYTDIFFEAIAPEYLDTIPQNWSFDPQRRELPIIIPQNYLNLYNFGFAPTASLPPLTREIISSLRLRITIYGEQGRREEVEGRVVAFTSRLNTILTPEEFVEWGNSLIDSDKNQRPKRLAVEFDHAKGGQLTAFIEDMGYEIEGNMLDFRRVAQISTFVLSAVLASGLLILCLSTLLLLLTLFLMIERNRTKIKQLTILGFTRKMICAPYIGYVIPSCALCFAVGSYIALTARWFYISSLQESLGEGVTLSPLPLGAASITLLIFALTIFTARQLIRTRVNSVSD